MKEEDKISKMQVFEENGWNFQTFKSGYVWGENDEEPLLPTGVGEADEEDLVQTHRPVQPEEEMLFPTGMRIGNGDKLLKRQRPSED